MKPTITTYSVLEEKLNVWSHGFGIVLSLFGIILLLQKGLKLQSTIHLVSYTIYGISMLVLFTASTLYHNSKEIEKRQRLNVFDHAAIYFLIAGTYTPFTLLGLQGAWGWSIFGIAWGIGLAGIILKLFFTGRFNLLSTISYVAMGWIIVIAIKPLIERVPFEGLMWLAIGGIFYTVGAVLYMFKKIPFNHAIFHFFVLGGAITHFIGVLLYT
jgi:hemolysin III